MTPLEAKEHLHTKGYCSFNIADLDYKLFDIVNQYKYGKDNVDFTAFHKAFNITKEELDKVHNVIK